MKIIIKRIALIIVILNWALYTNAQQDIPKKFLSVGDPAPKLRYSKWLQGIPVSDFEKDQIYVVEFWATWCGPCVAAMPHLSKLSEQYKGKITFIGMNVWENVQKDKPYVSVLPVLAKFVENQGDKLTYNVAVESNDLHMAKNWLTASLIPGIPVTFVIKNGVIHWIGHPTYIDKILEEVLQPNFDLAKYKQEYQVILDKRIRTKDEERKLTEPVDEALKAKNYQKAIALMEKAAAAKVMLRLSMDLKKFTTLLKFINEEDAIKFAEGTQWLTLCAALVGEEKGYSEKTYLWAINVLKKSGADGGTQDKIASVYAMMGDYHTALIIQKQAVETAKAAVSSGRGGKLSEASIVEFEKKLRVYQLEVDKKANL